MADKVDLKMFRFIFFVALLFQALVSIASGEEFGEVCNCYDKCTNNFTTNSVLDVAKTGACKRGCRFYAIVAHTSHEENVKADFTFTHSSCLLSCRESYKVDYEQAACISGCSEYVKGPCITGEVKTPQFSFSFMSETDMLFSAAELDPDYVHTDPGLRNQIALSEESSIESKQKLPEIRFKDLPVKSGGSVRTHVHANFKCPKFYGLDSKLEFRNGKVIVGDLYLFAGVFIFVVLCFLVGHQMESKGMRKQLRESRMSRKKQRKDPEEPEDEKEHLLKEGMDYDADYIMNKSELLRSNGAPSKFTRSITLVFRTDSKIPENGILVQYGQDDNQDYSQEYIPEKVAIGESDKFETVLDIDESNFHSDAPQERGTHQIV